MAHTFSTVWHPPLVAHSSPAARCLAWWRSTSSWVKRKDLPHSPHSYAVRLPRALVAASAGADTDGVDSREEESAAAAGGSCPGSPRGGDGGRPRGEDTPGCPASFASSGSAGRAAVSR
eukprot:scaffold106504_cov61-Phaeocystis_antarctica.AAC.3